MIGSFTGSQSIRGPATGSAGGMGDVRSTVAGRRDIKSGGLSWARWSWGMRHGRFERLAGAWPASRLHHPLLHVLEPRVLLPAEQGKLRACLLSTELVG